MMNGTQQIRFSDALRFWAKLGCISFGGPAGQIAIMHRELVDERRWISEARFLHALNFCMVLPGPEAQQLATYLGWLMHGTRGGILAGALFVLPSLVLIIALSWIYVTYGNLPLIAGIFYGIKPAVTAIVAQAAWRIGGRTLRNSLLVAIAAAAFIAIYAFAVPFPAIVMTAAAIGFVGGRVAPRFFAHDTPHGKSTVTTATVRALIDDDTPIEPRMRWRVSRAVFFAGIGIAIWVVGMLAIAGGGWQSTLPQMGWFFTKAALMTFGGAYAVLPYVFQGAVESFQWLSAEQMLDGLALGETTPGPLIMIVAFVGYLGGVSNDVVAGHPAWSGVTAACVATFFTFLPSFVFILVGGPLIESTRNNLRLHAPLTAITAAVVGVIVNLAVFFAWHIWWPRGTSAEPFAGGVDLFACIVTLAAGVALFRYKINVIWVIAGCGAVGALTALFGFPVA
jgi:chromate transporter